MNESTPSPESDDQFDEGSWSVAPATARNLLDLPGRSLDFLANLNEVLELLLPEQFPPGLSKEVVEPSGVAPQNASEPSESITHGTSPPHTDHR